MHKLSLDDFKVDSFATSETTPDESGAAYAPITYPVPYSMLGSCYGCPTVSDVTVCAFTVAADPAA